MYRVLFVRTRGIPSLSFTSGETRRKVHEKRKKKKVEDREGAEGRPKFGAQPRRAPLSYSPATPQPHPLIIRVNSQGSEWRSREKEFTKLSYIVQRMLPYKSLSPPPAVASSTLHTLIFLYTAWYWIAGAAVVAVGRGAVQRGALFRPILYLKI